MDAARREMLEIVCRHADPQRMAHLFDLVFAAPASEQDEMIAAADGTLRALTRACRGVPHLLEAFRTVLDWDILVRVWPNFPEGAPPAFLRLFQAVDLCDLDLDVVLAPLLAGLHGVEVLDFLLDTPFADRHARQMAHAAGLSGLRELRGFYTVGGARDIIRSSLTLRRDLSVDG